jgi:lipopolysaccharide export system protein LptC
MNLMLARTPQDGDLHAPVVDLDRAAAFARAQRHSRRVHFLKWSLPALALLMAGGFVASSYLSAPAAPTMQAEGTAGEDGKLVMANPKLDGFTSDNLPFTVLAEKAVQDVTRQGVVELDRIAAKVPLTEKTWADIAAARGVYDQASNTFTFDSEITIETNDGLVAKLKSARLDVNSGAMRTDDPVTISYDGHSITSDTMSVAQNGKVVTFENKVRVSIDPTRQTLASQPGE